MDWNTLQMTNMGSKPISGPARAGQITQIHIQILSEQHKVFKFCKRLNTILLLRCRFRGVSSRLSDGFILGSANRNAANLEGAFWSFLIFVSKREIFPRNWSEVCDFSSLALDSGRSIVMNVKKSLLSRYFNALLSSYIIPFKNVPSIRFIDSDVKLFCRSKSCFNTMPARFTYPPSSSTSISKLFELFSGIQIQMQIVFKCKTSSKEYKIFYKLVVQK